TLWSRQNPVRRAAELRAHRVERLLHLRQVARDHRAGGWLGSLLRPAVGWRREGVAHRSPAAPRRRAVTAELGRALRADAAVPLQPEGVLLPRMGHPLPPGGLPPAARAPASGRARGALARHPAR